MKIAFDFACDEAPLFSSAGRQFERDGHQVIGLTLGNRWSRWWRGIFRTYSLDIARGESGNTLSELQRLEREYGEFSPSSYAIADRFLAFESREYQNDALIGTFRRIEQAFLKEQPDVYFSSGIAYLYHLVSLAVCRKHGIKHISVYPTRGASPRFTVSWDRGGTWDLVDEHYRELLDDGDYTDEEYSEAVKYLKGFREKAKTPFYMTAARQSINLKPVFIAEFMTRMRYWFSDGWGRPDGDYITQAPWWYVFRDLKKLARAQFVLRKPNQFDRINENDEYYLFPLHLQPEASTLVLSEWYVNQLETIRNLSKTIPAGRFLYVKEHKSALGRHTLEFYRQIKSISNVKLIAANANTPELIKRSRGVIVLSSTMGWEALLFGRPVYVLGQVFYRSIPGAESVRDFNHLRALLSEHKALRIDTQPMGNDDDIVKYLIAIGRGTFDGHFDTVKMDIGPKVLAKENLEKFYRGLNTVLSRFAKTEDFSVLETKV